MGTYATAAKVKLVFAMRNAVDTVAGQVWLKAMEAYQKENPNVEFEYFGDQNGTAFLEKITVMGASVGFPDVMHLQNLWMIDFASINALDLVPKTLLGKLQNDLYPQSLKHLEYKGNVWGIPTELQVSAIMYNKQLMAQAGLADVPKTWETLIEQSKRLVSNSLNTNQKLSGLAVNAGGWGWSNNWHMLTAAYGGSYIDEKGVVELDTAVNRSVMERIVEWFAPNGPATKDRGQFQTGKAYFGLAFPFWSAYIKTIFKEQWEDIFGATQMPAGPAGTYGFQYGWGLSVPASSKNKEEAWKFIDWLATKTRESGVTSIGGAISHWVASGEQA
jgi:ABC-type glycerol-3-phosphate transport system substrate-binding protein